MSIHLNIELTDHCNLSCGMCSQSLRTEAHGVPMRFMDWKTWRAALAGLEEVSEPVHLCPHWLGEPTIHPQFDRFVEYAFAVNGNNRLFREFKLHTNGVVMSEERSRLLIRLAGLKSQAPSTFPFVHFSIDAWSAPVYHKVKGADRRDQVYANVERFLQLREELGAREPKVTLAFVVQKENAHEAHDFLAHWKGKLRGLGRGVNASVDWPPMGQDAIYFRPLNCADQVDADALHARVCQELGIVKEEDALVLIKWRM